MDFDSISALKAKRDYFNKINKEENDKKKEITESKKKSNFDDIYNKDSPMQMIDLLKFGESLDQEYEILTFSNKSDKSDRIGIPHALLEEASKFNFRTFEFEKKSKRNWREKDKKLTYLPTAKDNVKNEYYRALDKIASFGFEVWGVEKSLLKFKNRTWSSCCGGTCVYKFFCKKNHYKFVLEFIDDCDCEPGLLYVRKITDGRTGTEYNLRCDLYCQNTGNYELKDFLFLIESESLDDFVSKRYSKLLELFRYLEDNTVQINNVDKEQLKDPKILFESYRYLNFRITTPRGECILLLPHYRENDETCDYIFVGPSVEEYNKLQKTECWRLKPEDNDESKSVKIGHNEFYHNYKDLCFYSKLDDSRSNADIMELIDCYFNSREGRIGYLEDGTFYSDKHIEKFLSELKGDYSRSLSFENLSDYYNGPIIGIVIRLSSDNYYTALSYKENEHLYTIDFPYDSYKFTFWYDKGQTDCHLFVEGKYKMINQLPKIYYESKKIEDVTKDEYVFEPFEVIGPFTKVFDSLKEIVSGIHNIFNPKIEKEGSSSLKTDEWE